MKKQNDFKFNLNSFNNINFIKTVREDELLPVCFGRACKLH